MEVRVELGEVLVRCGVWTALAAVLLVALVGFWCGTMHQRLSRPSGQGELDEDEEDDEDDDDDDDGRPVGPLRPRLRPA